MDFRQAAALFALNASNTFYRLLKTRKKLGNVEFKLMFYLYVHCDRFSTPSKEMYYESVLLYVQNLSNKQNRKLALCYTKTLARPTSQNWQNQEMAT